MADKVVTIGQSTIQHGKDNDRVYLIKLADEDMPELLDKIDLLATEEGYGKIFAKVPFRWVSFFAEKDYTSEALVPFFFNGREDCHFMGKYFDRNRAIEPEQDKITKAISLVRQGTSTQSPCPGKYEIRRCCRQDIPAMAELFREVFESYPFPIHDPDYLSMTMDEDVDYFGIWTGDDRLVALSSAEQDRCNDNVEMTDFVTSPTHRRQGLARQLLEEMEKDMRKRSILLAYTIARAKSIGINKTFAAAGYIYGGTLIHNTQICGNLESMNVWHKKLA